MSETVERVFSGGLLWEEFGLEDQQRYEFYNSFYSGEKVLDSAGESIGRKNPVS